MTDDEKAAFDNALYYGVHTDDGELDCRAPEEAILEFLGRRGNKSVTEILDEFAPFPVSAYALEKPTQAWIDNFGDQFIAEFLAEYYAEYGNPNSSEREEATSDELNDIQGLLTEMVQARHNWRCAEVARIDYSRDEILAIVREFYPEWLGAQCTICANVEKRHFEEAKDFEVVRQNGSVTIIKRPVT